MASRGFRAIAVALLTWPLLLASLSGSAAEPESGAAAGASVQDPAEAESPHDALAGAPAQAAANPPAPGPSEPAGFERIVRAWKLPATSLNDRVERARRGSLEVGIWNLDSAARALLAGAVGSDRLERAHAAVQLAPDLPAGRIALAEALWLDGGAPLPALRAAFGALGAIPRHLEASLWFGGSQLFVLGLALLVGGAWCILLLGGSALPLAAHDFGDLLSPATPEFARAAFVAAAVLSPLAFGEGWLGLCAGLMAVGVIYGDLRQRLTLFLAATMMVAGAFPVLSLAGNALTVFTSDPVVRAALSTAQGFTHPVDQIRIEGAARTDPLAAQALALRARRAGSLGEADAYYQSLLRESNDDPIIANNAANVRLALGHMESALALYHRSLELRPDPVVLFNLSQAHGRAFQVEELSSTLADAQQLDGPLVAELTSLQGTEPVGFVVDLPMDKIRIWERVLRSHSGERIAAEMRAGFAPGRFGEDSLEAVGAFAAVLFCFGILGSRIHRAHWCTRCGRQLCQRCDPEKGGARVCNGCSHLYHQSETTDRELRMARLEALRVRAARKERMATIASILIPGAAGLLAKRPLRCLLGSVVAAIAFFALYFRQGAVPDPEIAGAAATFAAVCIAAVMLIVYALIVLACFATRRNA